MEKIKETARRAAIMSSSHGRLSSYQDLEGKGGGRGVQYGVA
jgi:hypothetical protein